MIYKDVASRNKGEINTTFNITTINDRARFHICRVSIISALGAKTPDDSMVLFVSHTN